MLKASTALGWTAKLSKKKVITIKRDFFSFFFQMERKNIFYGILKVFLFFSRVLMEFTVMFYSSVNFVSDVSLKVLVDK